MNDLSSELVSYIVHGLRNGTAAIYAWSEMLQRGLLSDPSEIAEAHAEIFAESQELTDCLSIISQFNRLHNSAAKFAPRSLTVKNFFDRISTQISKPWSDAASMDEQHAARELSLDPLFLDFYARCFNALAKGLPDIENLAYRCATTDQWCVIEMRFTLSLSRYSLTELLANPMPTPVKSLPPGAVLALRNLHKMGEINGGKTTIDSTQNQHVIGIHLPLTSA